MLVTNRELMAIITALNLMCDRLNENPNVSDEKKTFARDVLCKMEACQEFKLANMLKDEEKQCIQKIIDDCTKLTLEYSNINDLNQIVEYDKLLKKSVALHSYLGNLYAIYSVKADMAFKELDVILNKVLIDIMDNDDEISKTAAEKQAKVDERYTFAFGQYGTLKTYAAMLQREYETFARVVGAIGQSISTAKKEMITQTLNNQGV